MSKSHVSLTDDTLVVCPGDESKSAIKNPDTCTTAGGADDVHSNVDAKEALPPKNLTLAKGKRRAQVTNTANHANEASARKRSASQSLHISDQDLDEAYNEEFLEVANNLNEQQEELLAARLARQPVHRAHVHLTGGHTSMGAYERHLIKGVSLFIENIEAARCVLLAPHQIPLKEFTRLRKKSETKGGLHPDEVHQTRDRIYAIKIALDIGLGGLAADQFGKPTALMSYARTWTLSVARLGSSTGGLTAESQLPP
ncbi:Hypothetical protein PHPALM_10524 [Phytophthora palmivora]|uniref:Uncharacterized protein n=1 Tax=Phytophthora palmivora TaxID=4796 RepID=A0A2P4Y4M1_9STRA|nr:Hypothetical protein PHPALM_10524 [Phytophthora palmivora]